MTGRSVRLTVVAVLAAVLVGVAGGPAQAADRDPSTILVKFSIPSELSGALATFGDRLDARMTGDVVLVRLPAGASVDTAVNRYGRLFGVAYAEPNYIAKATDLPAPNDPSFSSQWSLGKFQAVAGWSHLFSSTTRRRSAAPSSQWSTPACKRATPTWPDAC